MRSELLASFRRLPTAGLQLDDRWADPGRLAAQAGRWVQQLLGLAAERTALAGLLFDVAWWAWAVSFAPPAVLESAWPPFLEGAGIDATDPELAVRVRSLQVVRMLELLADESSLAPEVQPIVAERLRAMLREPTSSTRRARRVTKCSEGDRS
jgi:hypothetical protein